MIPVIVIEGPTASGKSMLALQLARELKTDIISADSRQVYKRLDIGTSKPTKDEQKEIRHHLIDIIVIREVYTAGDFKKQAQDICVQLWAQQRIPIIAGGTGLYVRALLQGLFNIPDIPPEIKTAMRELYKQKGMNYIHDLLRSVDPESASRISVNDPQRTLRALEVWKFTGIPITEHWKKQETKSDFIPFRILMTQERSVLYSRIEKRLDTMMEQGILQEIGELLKDGYQWSDPGMNAVGYKEFKPFFEGEETVEHCLDIAKQHTRNYAKRQITWYNKCDFDLLIQANEINLYEIRKSVEQHFADL